jgi:hypothetical protein
MVGDTVLNQDFREFLQLFNDNGVLVNFIDLKNLKRNKRSVGRHQDLADMENLKE